MKARQIFSAMLATAVIGATAVSAAADTVSFTAIMSTIGQGFAVEPVQVEFEAGDNGLSVVKSAADILYSESDYGPYITAFANEDADVEIPAEIAQVCPEMTGRTADGYLSAYDYTPESGWSFFINGEYAMVGIGDYQPQDGDVLEFRYTVYGYGADLGIDNSSWGGAAALVPSVNAASLIRLCAEYKASGAELCPEYQDAMDALGRFGTTQAQIDAAEENLLAAMNSFEDTAFDPTEDNTADGSENKGSPDTGAEGIMAVLGAAVIAAGALCVSRKR